MTRIVAPAKGSGDVTDNQEVDEVTSVEYFVLIAIEAVSPNGNKDRMTQPGIINALPGATMLQVYEHVLNTAIQNLNQRLASQGISRRVTLDTVSVINFFANINKLA